MNGPRVPVLNIQSDWDEALRKIMGECWVSCKFRDEPGVHGKLKNEGVLRGEPAYASSCDSFSVVDSPPSTIAVVHNPSRHKCVFVAPVRAFGALHRKAVVSLDAAAGGLGVSACAEKLVVWDTKLGLARRVLAGHLGDVYRCRFFPSGVVVLSAGADMQLRVWSAETGQCPVTLQGHAAAVTGTCVVERGRNVVSVSKDGTARLWDCGRSACLGTLASRGAPANCCALLAVSGEPHLGEPLEPPSEREVGTEGKLLVLGFEDGTVEGVAVRSRRSVFSCVLPSAVNCVAALADHAFVAGCQDGRIALFDARGASAPLGTWFESNSAVLSLLPLLGGFLAGRADGMCSYHPCPSDGPDSFRIALTGSDCDAIYDMACDGLYVFTACRDSVIRKYDVHTIKECLQDSSTFSD
ncbi:proteasomal ATPase-associated factor 1-like [Bacillus rossius redtenbacheri]|uniref:proteasomal ATPase-associated factor 1-like n=1 Tax=Bacillus rossius redtenbacheri TaxID=93214 RepID=UPI002FDE3517